MNGNTEIARRPDLFGADKMVREGEERCAPLSTAQRKAKRAHQVSEKWRGAETDIAVTGQMPALYRAFAGLDTRSDRGITPRQTTGRIYALCPCRTRVSRF